MTKSRVAQAKGIAPIRSGARVAIVMVMPAVKRAPAGSVPSAENLRTGLPFARAAGRRCSPFAETERLGSPPQAHNLKITDSNPVPATLDDGRSAIFWTKGPDTQARALGLGGNQCWT
jgi:hypothetical protein